MSDCYDEEGQNISSLQCYVESKIIKKRREYKSWLSDTADLIAEAHSIENKKELEKLISHIKYLSSCYQSLITINQNKISIPEDHPRWSEVKKEINNLKINFDKVKKILDGSIDSNMVLFEALAVCDYGDRLPAIVSAIYDFEEIVEEASKFSGKGARVPLADWKIEAGKNAIIFWKDVVGRKLTIKYYAADGLAEASSPFSKFFIDAINKIEKTTPSQCNTILNKSIKLIG